LLYQFHSYTQTVPSRFKKGIVAAAKSRQKDENGLIGAAGMHRVMTNIKMADRITQQEMSIIFQGIGCESGLIHADEMMKFI
jgi:Ca2+-binding EF-hand superfamily protein